MPALVSFNPACFQATPSTAREPYHDAMLQTLTPVSYQQWADRALARWRLLFASTKTKLWRVSYLPLTSGLNPKAETERFRLFYRNPEFVLRLIDQLEKRAGLRILQDESLLHHPPPYGWLVLSLPPQQKNHY
mgnify:CR=1 FL=1